ncbi:hypothetical protein A2803_01035 [Candidatus Woesebacteria bacterium RIFCSPHIGHO2_01_FULL_44_21]|uniref:ABC transporter substrate-binding protein n=1 Tax=Candidatus Woesebacteria bacterium RIFCSPHIGHO2_01_FULL_44_21 TaxID=1802503 RepID=A0A1F7YWX7_9BACT|nr:MAG: hypothetical protein A2803_01035 [Candidatus Woesebacteria bacterium RIFCSPHIGHO2_01_FULL_44_21]OGM69718.1 MAG: hypothetical protein A2897_00225 [Candidatus Woesebacteria bacterium RIFCSPLOWO2_01_FULL_44_24b]
MEPNTNQMPIEHDIPAPGGPVAPTTGSVPASAPAPQTPVAPKPETSSLGTQMITPKGGGKFPKKLLFILLLVVFVIGVGFAVVKFILPNFRGISGSTELVWWGLWEDETLVQPLIEEYQNANPGVTIKYQRSDKEDYRERLTSALARGEGPDIFRLHNSWIPMFAAELEPAPSNILSSQDFQNAFYPVAAESAIGANGPLAVPLEYDGLAMFVNEEIFTTHAATIPTDWNDLREVAKALTIKDERGVITQSGVALGTTANVDHWPEIVALLLLQNGANPGSPNDAAGRGGQALSFYKQFSVVDRVWDDTQPTSTVAFSTGRVGMYFGPSWRALEIIERNPSLKFRVVPVPQVPKSDPSLPDVTYASYWVEGVSAKSKNVSEAWKFLKFMSERENLTKLYERSSASRPFGEPYSRVDMRDLLLADPVVGGFLRLAPNAKSSYLHSRTFDGASGINTALSQYYEDAINKINPTSDPKREMATLATGVQQVLSRYGLAAPLPTPED